MYIRRIATSIVAGTGAFFNAVLFLTILADPLKILRKGSWITIINLASADLIACVSNFFLVGRVMFEIKNIKFQDTCAFGWGLGVSASFMLLAFFTIQVYMITKYPFKAPRMLTSTKVTLSCAGIWLLAIPLAFCKISYLVFEEEDVLEALIAQITVLEVVVLIQIILKILICFEIFKSSRDAGQSHSRRHRQIATTVIIIIVVQLLTAVPYFASKQVEYLARMSVLPRYPLVQKFSYYYAPIAIVNFCVNPVLYSLRLPQYRRTLLSILRRKRDSQNFSFQERSVTTSKCTESEMKSCGKSERNDGGQSIAPSVK